MRKCIDLELEIRGLLRVFGIRLPPTLSHRRFEADVRVIVEADEGLVHALLPMLEARRHLYATFLELDRRVKAAARMDPVCLLLMTAHTSGSRRGASSRAKRTMAAASRAPAMAMFAPRSTRPHTPC